MLLPGGIALILCLNGCSSSAQLFMLCCMLQWQIIDDLVPVLQPFVAATEMLSSESNPIASCIMPLLMGLIKNNITSKPSVPEVVQLFKCKTRSGLSERFKLPSAPDFCSSVLAVASFWDPKHKKLSCIEEQEIRDEIKDHVVSILKKKI